jgi:hypothetical protein
MQNDIAKQLSDLATMPRHQLFDLWRRVFRSDPPAGMRREIFITFLAYRIQENAYGGLKPNIRADLIRIAKSHGRGKDSARPLALQKLKAGTRIIRKWRDEHHEIFVTDSGYEYRGVSYRSLSRIARKITGTRWSGPAFFGVKKFYRSPDKADA